MQATINHLLVPCIIWFEFLLCFINLSVSSLDTVVCFFSVLIIIDHLYFRERKWYVSISYCLRFLLSDVVMWSFSNHSSSREFLRSQTQHFKAARPDSPDDLSQAGWTTQTHTNGNSRDADLIHHPHFQHVSLQDSAVPADGSQLVSSLDDRRMNVLSFVPLKQQQQQHTVSSFVSILLCSAQIFIKLDFSEIPDLWLILPFL